MYPTLKAYKGLAKTRANYEQRGYGMFAVEMHSCPEVIGFWSLVHPQEQDEPDIKKADTPAIESETNRTQFTVAIHHKVFLQEFRSQGFLPCSTDTLVANDR